MSKGGIVSLNPFKINRIHLFDVRRTSFKTTLYGANVNCECLQNNFAFMGFARLSYIRPKAAVTPVWACRHRKGHPSEKEGGVPSGCEPPAI